MIDSIHIRLHNIKSYPNLLKYLLDRSKKQYVYEGYRSPNNGKEKSFTDVIFPFMGRFFRDSNTLMMANGERLTSSHYHLAYSLPLGSRQGYADFNFSIPKLLYGTNVLQFVAHCGEIDEGDWHCVPLWRNYYKANQEVAYRRLIKFLSHFFTTYLRSKDHVDLRDVEIRRIDITWNHLFKSKRDALKYLSYQKSIKKKHSRFTSAEKQTYSTSVFYSTRDYGCKIYHKGTEYASASGEKRKHLEANKRMAMPGWKGRKLPYDIENIQAFADRILRYEITFRNSYLSKIFWNHIYRRKDTEWLKTKQRYNEVRRIYDFYTGEHAARFKETTEFFQHVYMGTVDRVTYQREIAFFSRKYQHIDISKGCTKSDRFLRRWWSKQSQKRVSFRVKVDEWVDDVATGKRIVLPEKTSDNVLSLAKFSPKLLLRCFKIFDEFRDHFEIKDTTLLSNAVYKVEEYNENIRKLNEAAATTGQPLKKKLMLTGSMKKILNLLHYDTMESLVQRGLICRTTAYNWEKKFKELSITFRTGTVSPIWNCREFDEYHSSLMFEDLLKYARNSIFRVI